MTLVNTSLSNAVNQLKAGKVIGGSTIDDLYTEQEFLQAKIKRLESDEEDSLETPPCPGTETGETDEAAPLPAKFKVARRSYTMSPEALAQRRAAAAAGTKKMQEDGLATGPITDEGKKSS
ncbi:MAG: hypothetical protein OEU95_08020, partial [Nitrospirota bacterium]|nr:hypothetical protein [Nitrospirota bacterium]